MSRCECKAYPHDNWCSSHPSNAKAEELQEHIDELLQKMQQLESKLEVAVAAIKATIEFSETGEARILYDALKELEGMK